jgi:hypothetical protein
MPRCKSPCLALPCPALLCRCPSSASRPECLTKTRRVRRFDGSIPSLPMVCRMIVMVRYIAFDRKHLPCTHEIALRASVCVCAYPTGIRQPTRAVATMRALRNSDQTHPSSFETNCFTHEGFPHLPAMLHVCLH